MKVQWTILNKQGVTQSMVKTRHPCQEVKTLTQKMQRSALPPGVGVVYLQSGMGDHTDLNVKEEFLFDLDSFIPPTNESSPTGQKCKVLTSEIRLFYVDLRRNPILDGDIKRCLGFIKIFDVIVEGAKEACENGRAILKSRMNAAIVLW